jgi:hypothetical protein
MSPSQDNAAGPVKVAIVGLGMQGTLLINRLRSRPEVEIVAVVDADPAKVGRSVADIVPAAAGLDVTVERSHERIGDADVALVTTSSRIAEVAPVIEDVASRGVNVITTAEELGYPWHQYPELSERLDRVAHEHAVTIVGAGANPGFLMDLLPIILSHASERVTRVAIRRTASMRPHRPVRLTRFGLGRTPEEFAAIGSEVIYGHVGFTQSIQCMADALGWQLDEVREYDPEPLVIATEPREGAHFVVEPGTVAVVAHRAVGLLDGAPVIDVSMFLGFPDAGDDVPEADWYEISDGDELRTVEVRPPWTPFGATPSTVVNLLSATVNARAGLLSSVDFPARVLAARGSERS